eukprot:scaffold14810_cov48-Phaeocystis_antarctica.AAC.3
MCSFSTSSEASCRAVTASAWPPATASMRAVSPQHHLPRPCRGQERLLQRPDRVGVWPRAAASMSSATPTEKGSRVDVSLPLRKGGCRPASTIVPLSRRYGQGAPGLRGCAVTGYDHTEGALRAPQRVSRLIVASKRRHHECRVASSTCRVHVEAGSS